MAPGNSTPRLAGHLSPALRCIKQKNLRTDPGLRSLKVGGGTKAHLWRAGFCAGGREVRIRSLDRPRLRWLPKPANSYLPLKGRSLRETWSSRAYLPQQAAGRIRAEGWVLD